MNGPKCWTYKHRVQGVKVGARIAPNAFATAEMVTAQKPRRFADLAGFRFWAAPKACRNHNPIGGGNW